MFVAGSGFDEAPLVAWGTQRAISVDVLSSNYLIAVAPVGAELSSLRVETKVGSARVRVE